MGGRGGRRGGEGEGGGGGGGKGVCEVPSSLGFSGGRRVSLNPKPSALNPKP